MRTRQGLFPLLLACTLCLLASGRAVLGSGDSKPQLLAVKVDGKYGFIDTTGVAVIMPRFTDVSVKTWGEDPDLQWVTECEGGWDDWESPITVTNCYFIDKSGKPLTEERLYWNGDWLDPFPRFSPRYRTNHVLTIGVHGKGWGWIDTDGEITVPEVFRSDGVAESPFGTSKWLSFEGGPVPVKVGGCWGRLDDSGRWVIEHSFEGAGFFRDGVAPVRREGKANFIDRRGRLLFPEEYEWMRLVHQGLAWGENDGKWGLVCADGTYVLRPQFDKIRFWPQDLHGEAKVEFRRLGTRPLFAVQRGDRWGVVNDAGGMVLPIEMQDFFEDLWWGKMRIVQYRDQWGALAPDCSWEIEPVFDHLGSAKGSWHRPKPLVARKDGTCGIVDAAGNFVWGPFPCLDISTYEDCVAAVETDTGWGLMNDAGELIVKPTYRRIWSRELSNHGFFFVERRLEGKALTGIANLQGRLVVPPEFRRVKYVDGPAPYFVAYGEKCGVFGADGSVVVDIDYDDIKVPYTGPGQKKRPRPLPEELFAVKKDGKWGYIDAARRFTVPLVYDDVWYDFGPYASPVTMVLPGDSPGESDNRRTGLVARYGSELLPCEYDHVGSVVPFGGEIYAVSEEGKCGYFHVTDGWIWRPTE